MSPSVRQKLKSVAFVILRAIPYRIRIGLICTVLKSLRRPATGRLYCNVCDSNFASFQGALSAAAHRSIYGVKSTPKDLYQGLERAFCPVCGEAERERLLFALLETKIDIAGKRVLHAAPGVFAQRILFDRCQYVSSDYKRTPLFSKQADLTALSFPDQTFDVVIAFHVLEHIADDRQALREIRRILSPNGILVVCVPQALDDVETDDNDPVDPEQRTLRFGHPDHRRLYGSDFSARVEAEGFQVETLTAKDANDEDGRLSLLPVDRIHVGTKLSA